MKVEAEGPKGLSKAGPSSKAVKCSHPKSTQSLPVWASQQVVVMGDADGGKPKPQGAGKPHVPANYVVPDVWEFKQQEGSMGAMNRPDAGPRSDAKLPVGDHAYQLYSLGTPNGQKVTVLLEELGAEYDAWYVDIMKLEQFSRCVPKSTRTPLYLCLAVHGASSGSLAMPAR